MKLNSIRKWLVATGLACLAIAPALADEPYPSKPIKLVAGFPPGGPTDIIARVIAQALGKELNSTVIIDNRAGAGGVIGADAVAKSKPDGYTLLVAVESSQTRGQALNPGLPYDQVKDFTYIRNVAKQRNLVVVNPDVPVNSIKELIAFAKANPGKLNFGGTFGATSHIGGTLFDARNGTQLTFVNYKGGAQPITDLMAGVVQVGFFTEATVAQHIRAGKIKALAVAAPERSPAFPDLPTIQEAGSKPVDLSPWFGIAAPAGMPSAIVQKIAAALDKVVTSPDFLTQLESLGAVPVKESTPDLYTKQVAKEIVFWNDWAKSLKTPLAR
ncbi:Bug family tripartite tricarboxylate transporter substrate binding protein [Variovorax paradoxus]|uniref:Bug family tripartite tricarboxylate transporter substrate binding protein n=1 Tax=Variovorax paradoxus TaxID=34073 RepID=UPI0027896643|nr:tripartite tricarboxylate transporter substrate binding protein [Variovorax paradoxus]MDQ0589966.1 tripartite-type tricarboxylate transporter receptor subunit TctC [Variovorax paradoxus]